MSEIFISYAKQDRGRAKEVATRLEQEGWSVFWDRTIPVASTWDEVLEHGLSTMKVMVVLWSRASVASEWVRIEAEEGASRKILVPVLLEEVLLPIRFRALQAADISDWIAFQPDTLGMNQLIDAIARIGHFLPRNEIKAEMGKPKEEKERTDEKEWIQVEAEEKKKSEVEESLKIEAEKLKIEEERKKKEEEDRRKLEEKKTKHKELRISEENEKAERDRPQNQKPAEINEKSKKFNFVLISITIVSILAIIYFATKRPSEFQIAQNRILDSIATEQRIIQQESILKKERLAKNTKQHENNISKNTNENKIANVVWYNNKSGYIIDQRDNHRYEIVKIGNQVWMAENLKTTKFNDGTSIPLVTDGAAWKNLTTPGYCYFDNDSATYKITYGVLYNWHTIKTGKLAPDGWHVPTDDEWTTLANYLGGNNIAGGELKEVGLSHWASPNTGATNSSGFTALPSGSRFNDGNFHNSSWNTNFWTSTELSSEGALIRNLVWQSAQIFTINEMKNKGNSVRCIKD